MSPYSYVQRPFSGTIPQTVPFPFLAREHVRLLRNFSFLTGQFDQLLVVGVDYAWANDTMITPLAPMVAMTGVLTILRATPISQRIVDWVDASNLTASPLDTSDLQFLYLIQELWDRGAITGSAIDGGAGGGGGSGIVFAATVAGLPVGPAAGTRAVVLNSTGLEVVGAAGMPPGFVGSADIEARLRWAGTSWVWESYQPKDPDARYSGAGPEPWGQATVTLTLEAGATGTGVIEMPSHCTVYAITASKAGWVRVYDSAAGAATDAPRVDQLQWPGNGRGIVADPVFTSGERMKLSPVLIALNQESPRTQSYPVRVRNDGAPGAFVLTLDYFIEAP